MVSDVQLGDLERLRALSIAQPEAQTTRWLAIAISLVLLGRVLLLVHRGRLREEYTPIWIGLAVAVLAGSVWFDGVRWLTRAIGAWTPSSTFFFFGVLFLLMLGLNYAERLSTFSAQVNRLAQEVALLRGALAVRAERPEADDAPGNPPA
jgi:hypothetical protein